MTQQGRLYHFACWLLWVVMSHFDLLYDTIPQTDEVNRQSAKWFNLYMVLTNWLSEARFFPLEIEEASPSFREQIHRYAENLGDLLYSKWNPYLVDKAQNAASSFPKIDVSMHLYFYYCPWLSKTLNEFDRLFQKAEISSTQYAEHYQQEAPKFRELSLLLQNETPNLDDDEADNQSLVNDIESTAQQLAQEWQKAVYDSAENFSV